MAFKSRNYPPEHGILIPRAHQRQVIRDLLCATPMRASDADYLADRLVTNDGRCLYSHGSRQLPHYLENLNGGNVNPEPNVQIVSAFGATARVDGDGGLGYMACRVGMEKVLELTAQLGTGACTTGNHFHVGSVGTWTRMAAAKGYIGMAMSAHRNRLDASKMISHLPNASPISFAFPAGEQPPLVIDMSLSKVARGKVNVAAQRGESIPEGWALDSDGQPTTDPNAALAGTMLPMGEAKGAQLVLMVEILAGAISASNFGFEASSFFLGEGDAPRAGQLLLAIDPGPLSGGTFGDRLEVLCDAILGQPGTRLPGSSRETARANAAQSGVNIGEALHAQLLELVK